ncbi:winged helix-turn-helix transcriptional regulator [Metabacillus litoralis]|uniref:winged helix-turn-helix transcriptional regulator n=1 Tax=Metabacillus litoralis TaxID=152268 RepID=UPI002040E8C8|nr:winged helix-turn-helix transcriptional regulator [Metabacillus litoralis]MCM3653440.1 winged helix-turn-helix transcriptional regulator [Metabacillus litoralis]
MGARYWKELEKEGLVKGEIIPKTPALVEYSLSRISIRTTYERYRTMLQKWKMHNLA